MIDVVNGDVYSAPAAATNVTAGSFPSVSTPSAMQLWSASLTSMTPLKFAPSRRAVSSQVIGPAAAALKR